MSKNNKKMKNMRATIVEESMLGLYVWITPDGKVVADEDGNYLNIEAMKGDQRKIDILREAAKEYGVDGGRAKFFAGFRRVSDEEYQKQMQRLEMGLIPDELDIPAFMEEYENMKKRGGSYGE